jgi:DNA-binding MurR/RpiR family transcriptional regulator
MSSKHTRLAPDTFESLAPPPAVEARVQPGSTAFKLPAEMLRALNPRRRELIRPVLDRPRDYVLLSVRKLAEALDADAMAVLRAIRGMGFDGYAEFRQYLHELALVQATQLDPMEAGLGPNSDVSTQLYASLSRDSSNLLALQHSLDLDRVEGLAGRLYGARRIVLLGGDLATGLVTFLQYNLAVIDLPAIACTRPGEVVHAVRNLDASDVVIAITFRRGLRQTVEGLRRARAKGAYCVGVTDTHLSPLARFAHEYFVTSVESTLYGVSYVAPMAWLNTLLVACAATRPARIVQLLKTADREQRTGFRWYRDDVLPSSRTERTSSRVRKKAAL